MELFFSKELINNKFYNKEYKSEIYKQYTKLVDLYIYLSSSEFFILAILQLIIFGTNALLLIFFSLFLITLSLIFIKINVNREFHATYIIIGSLLLFFTCYFSEFHYGYIMYYLLLFYKVSFTLDPKDNYKLIIFIYSLLFTQVIILLLLNYSLLFNKNIHNNINTHILISNTLFCIISFFIYKYLIIKKEMIYSDFINLNIETINVLAIKSKINSDDDIKLIELKNIAEKNPNLFYIKFSKNYPLFIEFFKEKYPDLNINEIETCLFFILNYSAKDVARFTNNSVRAIESKKYRIRRKLELNSNENLNEYLILLFNQNNLDF
jgi:DNA-binding CsgD family transcriptional regulator